MRLRLRLYIRGCRDTQRGDEYTLILLDLSASTEEDADEDDIDLESCFEYEYEQDLGDIERPWRLNSRRFPCINERGVVVSMHESDCGVVKKK